MMNAALIPLVERLYEVAPARCAKLRGCDCCDDDDSFDRLTQPDRRELDADLLGSHVSRIVSYGDRAQFRYFAPRLMELLVQDAFNRFDTGEVEHAFERSKWRRWPRDETNALERLRAEDCFVRIIESRPLNAPMLQIIGDAGAPMLHRLEAALQSSSLAPAWLARLWCEFGQREGRWQSREAMVGDWLLSLDAAPQLERAFFRAESTESQQLFSSALQCVEWYA